MCSVYLHTFMQFIRVHFQKFLNSWLHTHTNGAIEEQMTLCTYIQLLVDTTTVYECIQSPHIQKFIFSLKWCGWKICIVWWEHIDPNVLCECVCVEKGYHYFGEKPRVGHIPTICVWCTHNITLQANWAAYFTGKPFEIV